MEHRYTVTVCVAAPGAPLPDGSTSASGHLNYQISGGEYEKRYGSSPQDHEVVVGPGRVRSEDAQTYQSPLYGRTMDVAEGKYSMLKEFDEAPGNYSFNPNYNRSKNSSLSR